jgi:hypothetical protein
MVLWGVVGAMAMKPDGHAPGVADRVAVLVVTLGSALGFVWASSRLRIEVRGEGVTFVGVFSTSSAQWQDIRRFVAGYWFTMERVDGSVVRSAALGKARWRSLLRNTHSTRADRVADQLNARLVEVH